MNVNITHASNSRGNPLWSICNPKNITGGGRSIFKLLLVVWVFLTIPLFAQAPVMVYPINTLTGVTLLPNFQWSLAGYTTETFDLVITQTTPAGATVNKTGLTGLSYQWTETDGFLTNGATYTYTLTVHGTANTTTGTFKTMDNASMILTNPSNNRLGYIYTKAIFNWASIVPVGTNNYVLQVFAKTSLPTAAEWALGPTTVYTGKSTNYTMNLTPNTQYYWRVLMAEPTGGIVSVSPVWTFTTTGGPVLPYLSFPTKGVQVLTNTPTLYWYTFGVDLNNVVFDVRIYDATYTPFYIATGVNNIKLAVPAGVLNPGTRYIWKVEARALSGGAPIASDTSSFVTAGIGTVYKPTLSFPLNNVTVYSVQPSFYWYIANASNNVTYTVNVYNDAGLTSLAYTSAPGAADVFTHDMVVPALIPGNLYYWNVIASNTSGALLVSNTGTFRVSGSLGPGSPHAAYPVYSGDIVYSNLPTLFWWMSGTTTGLHHYKVAWTSGALPANDAAWDVIAGNPATSSPDITDVTKASYTLASPPNTPLAYGQHYFWAVTAQPLAGPQKPWSVGEFNINGGAGVGVPNLCFPIQGITVVVLKPMLSWWFSGATTGIVRYFIELSRTSTFAAGLDPAGDAYTVSYFTPDASLAYTLPANLKPGATYYWRVSADYGGGNIGGASSTGSFVVSSGSKLVVPLAESPAQGVGITSGSADFSWALPTDPGTADIKYEVQHSTNASMTEAKTVSDISTANVNVSGLESGKTYYWRVRSTNSKGEHSDYSEVAKFSVSSVTAVENTITEMPLSFSLEQNYPNPFNPVTEIRFGLMKDGFTTLKIYNVLGREIRTLLSETKQAGTYRMQWDGKDNNGSTVQSGTYVYRLVNGNDVSAKKMIMLK